MGSNGGGLRCWEETARLSAGLLLAGHKSPAYSLWSSSVHRAN